MSVYLDPIRKTTPTGKWPFPTACHMWADSLDELQAFAGKLGLAPYWMHTIRGFVHYDLTELKRRQAVDLGAIEVDGRAAVKQRKEERAKPTPAGGDTK